MSASKATLEKIVSLCKRRGFVYQSGEIYGGLNGVYDCGPLGALLKHTIKNRWLTHMMSFAEEVVLVDGSLLGSADVWKASGHLDNFSDPMVDCMQCKKRYRADDVDLEKNCPSCGNKQWTAVRQFNLMFKTELGAMSDATSAAYLRPETAQAIFINFKNVMSSFRVKVPFGIAQIGKAFRNEITPKQFLFRMREFEQMEMEFFCKGEDAARFFDLWVARRKQFFLGLGINPERIRLRPHASDELAHYSKACIDVEYEFPFGFKELEGIANRADFDLSQHSKHSGKDLGVFDEATKSSYMPHVVECSVGVDRLFLTLLFDAYDEDEVDGEVRTVLRFHPAVAPYTAAIMPLSNKLTEKAEKIFLDLKAKGYRVQFDDGGSIGKRYRRQDEIGTPVCLTYDFETETDGMVTARNRDTMKQERVAIGDIQGYLDRLMISK
ncbi:glycine--tRNA ligase [Candidatus Dependentiae bacterium]|nr:glycine--tRNA ligase [Candidatus Dependentiae bacterium]